MTAGREAQELNSKKFKHVGDSRPRAVLGPQACSFDVHQIAQPWKSGALAPRNGKAGDKRGAESAALPR